MKLWSNVLSWFVLAALLTLGMVLSGASSSGAADDPNTRQPKPRLIDPTSGGDLDSFREFEERRRARRKTPEARERRRGSRDSFRSMARAEALTLLREKHPELLQPPVWKSVPLERGERVDRFIGEFSARVEDERGRMHALESTLPLRSDLGDGEKRLVDLGLEDRGAAFGPENPLVDVRIGKRLSQGVQFNGEAFGLRLESPSAEAEATATDDRAVTANALADTDLIVMSTPLGAQLSLQVRSVEAPEQATFKLDLPARTRLRLIEAPERGKGLAEGSAVIELDDRVLASIERPVAWDADGEPLNTHYTVDGDRLVVHYPHRNADVLYPVVVDPNVVERERMNSDGSLNTGGPGFLLGTDPIARWGYMEAPAGIRFNAYPTPFNGFFNAAIGVWSDGGYYYANDTWGQWAWYAPRRSSIYRADFNQIAVNNPDVYPRSMCASAGIWRTQNPQGWEEGLFWTEPPAGSGQPQYSGPWRGGAAPKGSCTTNGNRSRSLFAPFSTPGNGTSLALFAYGPEWRIGAAAVSAQSAAVHLVDFDVPSIGSATTTAPNGWVHSAPVTTAVNTRDGAWNAPVNGGGLGMWVMAIFVPQEGGGDFQNTHWNTCEYNRLSRCPEYLSRTFSYSTDDVDPTAPVRKMPEGENTIRGSAWDVLVKETQFQSPQKVKVDRSPPVASVLGGSLYASRETFTKDDAHTLTVDARDDYSGVKDITYEIKNSVGQVVKSGSQPIAGCSPINGCPKDPPPHTFNVDLAGLDTGDRYTTYVTVKDQLGDDATYGSSSHRAQTSFRFRIDRFPPTVTSVTTSPDRWFKNGDQATTTVAAHDPGAGIKSLNLALPAGSQPAPVIRSCGGIDGSSPSPPCQLTDSAAFPYTIDSARFPDEGRRTVTGKATNPAGAESAPVAGHVRVDRSAPQIEASGSLYDARDTILFRPTYQLNATGKDGSTASPADERSGTKRIRILVKEAGQPDTAFVAKRTKEEQCVSGNCSLSESWTLNTSEYANKQLTIRSEATDQLDHQSTKDFNVWVLADLGGTLPLVEDRLGLEEFWNYDSTETGAGSRAHVNLDSGNLVWHSVPVVNPGRGLSTVVNLTANSQETPEEALVPENALGDSLGQYNAVGRGFSLGISGLLRVNDRLDLSKLLLEQKVRITDVDGTRHTFTSSDSCKTFAKPPGVHLRLRRYSSALVEPGCGAGVLGTTIQATDPLKFWAATRPDGVTHFFDTHGYQTSIEDRNGNTIRFRYEFRSQAGGACVLASDPDGKLAGGQSIVPPDGCPRRLTKVIDPESREMVLTYHVNRDLVPGVKVISGLVKDVTDFGGRKLFFEYDASDYLTKVTQAYGTGDARAFGFDYEGAGTTSLLKRRALTQVTDPNDMASTTFNSGRTTFTHASDGPPALGSLGDGLVSRKRTMTVTNRRSKGRSVAYQPISEGDSVRKATVTDALTHQWVHKMDVRGRARSLVDPESTETTLAWDDNVNGVSQLIEAAGSGDAAVTNMTYNANGQLLTQTTHPVSGETRTRTLTYRLGAGKHIAAAPGVNDSSGTFVTDLETITNPKASTGWAFGLDDRGNVTSRTDAASRSATTTYDGAGRVTSETDEEGNVTTYEQFHPSGQPKLMIDPRGNTLESGDALTNHRWIYKYDLVGNVTDVTDPRGAKTGGVDDARNDFTTKLTYDALDRLRIESIPKDTANNGIERLTKSRIYDANDNVTASIEGDRTTAIRYTPTDRPDRVTAPGSEISHYGYDDLDQLTSRTDPKGGETGLAFKTEYLLDDIGRRIAETRNAPNETPAKLITSYAFDKRDNVIGMIDPKRNNEPAPSAPARTAAEAATAAETEANLRTKFDFNDADELVRQVDKPNGADTTAGIRPAQTEFEYDGNGNRTAVIGSREFDSRDTAISDFKTDYEFDHRDQLISVTNPADEKMVYTRRRDGKVIAQTSPRGVENGTRDSAVAGGIEPYKYFTTRFGYNANGDLTSRSVPFRPDQYGRTDEQLKAWQVGYQRDPVGNPTTITDARGTSFTNTFYDTGDVRTTGRPSWWTLDWGEAEHAAPNAGERLGEAGSDEIDTEIATNGPALVQNGGSTNVTGDASAPDLPSSESAGNFGEVDPEQLPGLLPSAGQTKFTYDNEMRLTHVEDAATKTREITYEPSGRVDKKIWPFKAGEKIEHEYGYDANGNLTAYKDGRGQLTAFGYDGFDRRTSETAPGSRGVPGEDPEPEETVYAHDPNGNLEFRVTPLGETRKFQFGYDSLDRLEVETNPAGESWSYAHNTAGAPIVERSPRGQSGSPVVPPSPDPAGAGTIFDTKRRYDAADRLSEVVNGFGDDTDFEYDKDGNRTRVTAPGAGTEPNALDVDRVMETSYDGRGLPWQETIGSGSDRRTTVKEFNPNGSLRRIVNPKGLGSDREPSYDDTGISFGDNLRDATKNATVRFFTNDDLLSEEFFPWGDRDARDQRRFTQKWTRDARGRVQTHTSAYEVGDSTAPQKSYSHFDTDWVSSVSDEEIHNPDPPNPRIYGQQFEYEYDKAGNQTLWESENSDTANGRKITRTFYPSGLLASRRAQKAVEDTHTTRTYSYFYNPNRSLVRMDDTNPGRPTGQELRTTTFSRDAAEREQIVNETWTSGKDSRFVYDEAGNVTRRQTDGRWSASTGTYVDSAGGRDDAKTTDFTYDRLEREKTMRTTQGSDPTRGVDRDYWASGELQLKTTLKPGVDNNIAEARFYTTQGDVAQIRRQRIGASSFQKDQSYSYDANGNRTEDERGEHEFNARDQLVEWTRPDDHKVVAKRDTTVTYELTANGAIDKKTDTALPGSEADDEVDYTYAHNDRGTRLAKVVSEDTTQTYSYDDFGSVIRIQSKLNDDNTVFPPLENLPSESSLPPACEGQLSGADKDTALYCFDEFERMVTGRGSGFDKKTAVYDYDGFDRRDSKIERVAGGTDERRDFSYIGSSRSLSRETNYDGKTLYYDYNSAGEREGQSKAPAGQTEPTVYRSYGKDANGSVEGIEEENGTVPEDNEYVYDPYGDRDDLAAGATDDEAGHSPAAQDNPFRFEGFYLDSGVKTYDMQARQYRPDTGRFLTQDRFEAAGADVNVQSDPLTQNRYAFAGGNPTNNVEFDGHRVCNSGTDCGGSNAEAGRRNTEVRQGGPLTRQQRANHRQSVQQGRATYPVRRPTPRQVRARQVAGGHVPPPGPLSAGEAETFLDASERVHSTRFSFGERARLSDALQAGTWRMAAESTAGNDDLVLGVFGGVGGGAGQAGRQCARLCGRLGSTIKGLFGLGGKPAASAAARRGSLRANLSKAHGPLPPGYEAHHLVAVDAKRAAGARRILDRFGIDPNSAVNGVALPGSRAGRVAGGAYHPSIHTNRYYDAVETRLAGARSRREATRALGSIRRDIQSGDFP